jgi:hypothetical protein
MSVTQTSVPVNEIPRITFKDRATPVITCGIPVIPLLPRTKDAFLKDWPDLASSDPAQIEKWNADNPDYNMGVVAKAKLGGVWFFEYDSGDVAERIFAETGKKLPPTFHVESRSGRGHLYFKMNERAISAGNFPQGYVKGGDWSGRISNQYVVGPLSVHPTTGLPYRIKTDVPIVEAPDWFFDWMEGQRVSKATPETVERDSNGLIPHGFIHDVLVSVAGKLVNSGLTPEGVEHALLDFALSNCAPPLDEDHIRQVARSTDKWKRGNPLENIILVDGKIAGSASSASVSEKREAKIEVLEVEENSQMLDMPEEAILNSNLGDICFEHMKDFPLAYAWPALLTVAGTMVPRSVNLAETLALSAGAGSQTNLYTALVGPVGSGKTQAIEYAVGNLGLSRDRYTDTKAGSIEGLLAKLAENNLTGQILVDLDEWSHLFKKAGIENASFVDILNSGFNKPEFHLTIAGGRKIDLNCALSMIGGIVTDKVQECFGASSTGGFHDRFLFGVCPSTNRFQYMPFDFSRSALSDSAFKAIVPAQVKIDRSVWELASSWKKHDMSLGRSVEVTIRCCSIVASFDGLGSITGHDLERMRPFLDYQQRCRKIIVPGAGVTTDARMSNAILGWLKRHADEGQWVNQRALKKGIHKVLDELGPTAFKHTMGSLAFIDAIDTKLQPNDGARPSHLIRLLKGM